MPLCVLLWQPPQVYRIIAALPTIHWPTVIVGGICFALFFGYKYVKGVPKWVPFQLIVVAATMLLSFAFDFEGMGIRVTRCAEVPDAACAHV